MPALPKFINSAASNSATDTAVAASTSSPERRDGQPSMADAPFHCPPDIVLDFPVPVSVNKTRRIDWTGHRRAGKWKDQADRYLMVAKRRAESPIKLDNPVERFEIHILLSEATVDLDADNACKVLIDYLRHRSVIKNDSKQHMRRLVVEWGRAPAGCRVTIRALAHSFAGVGG